MGKAFKIVLAILLTLVAAALILFLTLGGLPAKKMAEKNTEYISYVAKDYPYADIAPLENGMTLEDRGLRMQIPAGMHPRDDSDPDSMKAHLYVSDTDKALAFIVLEPFDFEEFDLDGEKYDFSEKTLNWFSETIGIPHSGSWDWYSFYNLLYHMDMDDCSIHSFRQANTFYALALIKDQVISHYHEVWDWHTDCGNGFISIMQTPESSEKNPKYKINASLYFPDSPNVSHDVMIAAKDIETCCAIVNSITRAD